MHIVKSLSLKITLYFRRNKISTKMIKRIQRESYLSSQKNRYKSSKIASTIVLQSNPHIGKSFIAHEFAFQDVTKFKQLWNLSCSSEESLKHAVTTFAIHLNISVRNDNILNILQEIYKELGKQKGKTLLIFDGLQEEQAYLLPSSIDQLHVIVTTHAKAWKAEGDLFPIGPFTQQKADALLKTTLDDYQECLVQILDLFMSHPLALSLAAHYLKTTKMDPQLYKERLKAKLRENPSIDSLFSSLWKFVKNALESDGLVEKKRLPLVKLCACNSSYPISKKKLENWLKDVFKNEDINPEDPVNIILRDLLLKLYKFLILDSNGDLVWIHPIIAEIIRKEVAQEEFRLYSNL